MENVKIINKYLESTYGRAQDNKPKFRVVYSDDLFEIRKGIFHELQVIETIQKAPKYSYISERFILEVYTRAFPEQFGRALMHSKDTILDGDFYEPLRVFQTKKGIYLRPDLEICKILCDNFVELINRPEARRLTDKIATSNDAIKIREEVKKFEEILNMDDSDIMMKFRDKEAIILPGKEIGA